MGAFPVHEGLPCCDMAGHRPRARGRNGEGPRRLLPSVDPESRELVERLRRQGLADDRVAAALARVPRRLFVPEESKGKAYVDEPLAIGEGQTISAPHMVALMALWLDLRPGQKVLEIGGGSGWHAAVTAELVAPDGEVWTVERLPALAATARRNLAEAGRAERVHVVVGDGSRGLADEAPYDRIFVAAASPGVPAPLVEQLAEGGRLLLPVGSRWEQELKLFEKTDPPLWRDLGPVRFVPMIGEHGFPS